MPYRKAQPLPVVSPIIPQLRRAGPFRDPAWVFELKVDGFRGMLYLDGQSATFYSKRRRVLSRFADLATVASRSLSVRNGIFDGEVIALDQNGNPDFKDLMRGSRTGRTLRWRAGSSCSSGDSPRSWRCSGRPQCRIRTTIDTPLAAP
jgi:bifunctional non-homologous end joining protein LigD